MMAIISEVQLARNLLPRHLSNGAGTVRMSEVVMIGRLQASGLSGLVFAGAVIGVLASGPASSAETRIAPLSSPIHPMDGLTADEIRAAVDVLRAAQKFDDTFRIVFIALDENGKDEVRAWRAGQSFARRATATLLKDGRLFEARIDIGEHSRIWPASFLAAPNASPVLTTSFTKPSV